MKIKNVAQFLFGGLFAASVFALPSISFADTVPFATQVLIYFILFVILIGSIISFLLIENKDHYMGCFYAFGVAIVNSILNKVYYKDDITFYEYYIEGQNTYKVFHI